MKTIAIIGGGITGITTAYALAKQGYDVTVIERHRYAGMETSFANGGQLSASNAEVWTQQYEFAQFSKARVGMYYCITVDGCAYSVPWQLAGKEVDLRIGMGTIEVLYKGGRVASHAKSHG